MKQSVRYNIRRFSESIFAFFLRYCIMLFLLAYWIMHFINDLRSKTTLGFTEGLHGAFMVMFAAILAGFFLRD